MDIAEDQEKSARLLEAEIENIRSIDHDLLVDIQGYEEGKIFWGGCILIPNIILLIASPFAQRQGLTMALGAGIIVAGIITVSIVKNVRYRQRLKKFNTAKLRLEHDGLLYGGNLKMAEVIRLKVGTGNITAVFKLGRKRI